MVKVKFLQRLLATTAFVLIITTSSFANVYASGDPGHDHNHMVQQPSSQTEGHSMMDMNHFMDMPSTQQSEMKDTSVDSHSDSHDHYEDSLHNSEEQSSINGTASPHSSHAHGDNSSKTEKSGPNWPVLYGFGAVNSIVIITAAIMKFAKREVKINGAKN